MANTDDKGGARAQAVVSDGLAGGAFRARVGTSEFAVGGQSGTDPYELLSVSLAACTAMTLRFHAGNTPSPTSRSQCPTIMASMVVETCSNV